VAVLGKRTHIIKNPISDTDSKDSMMPKRRIGIWGCSPPSERIHGARLRKKQFVEGMRA